MSAGPQSSATIVRDVYINAPVDRVWAALSQGEQLAAWFSDSATLDRRAGGSVEWRWATGAEPYVAQGTVKEALTGKKLVIAAGAQSSWPNTLLTFTLNADGTGTLLTLNHEGFAPGKTREAAATWSEKLEALRGYAESGHVRVRIWDVERIRARVLSDKSATMGAVFGYLIGKLGPEAAAELTPLQVKAHASYYRQQGLESPLHFAGLYAAEHLNVYGERMTVSGTASRAVIERRDRSSYDTMHQQGFPGDYVAFLNSSAQYATALIRELGFASETEIGPHGYRLVIKRAA